MNISSEVLRNGNSKKSQALESPVKRREFLSRAIKGLIAVSVPSLILSANTHKALADGGGDSCPADAIFYWSNDNLEAWARPVEPDLFWGEHFNLVLHQLDAPPTNYLFNYHVNYAGIQTLDDGNDYHIFQVFDQQANQYEPDMQLLAANYSDNQQLATDVLNQLAGYIEFISPPAQRGIDLSDLANSIETIASDGGGLVDQVINLIIGIIP